MDALSILQVSTGTFFTISGYRKVFRPEVRNHVIPFIMQQAHVPKRVAWTVILLELVGGLLLFTPFYVVGAAPLLGIMGEAYISTIWPEVRAKHTAEDHWTKLASNALCTPEAQFIFILGALLVRGLS